MALRADGSMVRWGTNRIEVTGAPEITLPAAALEGEEDRHLVLLAAGPPRWGQQITAVRALAGGPFTLCPNVMGAAPLHFQWLHNGRSVPGATNRCLSIPQARAADAGSYVLLVWNPEGSSFSQQMPVTVDPASEPTTRVGGWGDNRRGQLVVPHDLEAARSISAGAQHAVAVSADGSVRAWGKNVSGQTNVPPAATNVLSVAAGGDHSLAVRMAGSVLAWGDNDFGQTEVPLAASNVFSVAAGGAHSLALVGNGSSRFTLNPVPHLGYFGQAFRLTAPASSPCSLDYQWQLNGTDLPGATNASLLLPDLQWPQVGRYRLLASNSLGVVVSREVLVTLPGSPLVLEGYADRSAASPRFVLKFRDLSGAHPLIVYASSNLVAWQSIFTNTPSLDWAYYLDSANLPPAARFYRLGAAP